MRQHYEYFSYNEEFLTLILDNLSECDTFFGTYGKTANLIDGDNIVKVFKQVERAYMRNKTRYSYPWRENPLPGVLTLEHTACVRNGCPAYAIRSKFTENKEMTDLFHEWVSRLKSKDGKGNFGKFFFWFPYGYMKDVAPTVTKIAILSKYVFFFF